MDIEFIKVHWLEPFKLIWIQINEDVCMYFFFKDKNWIEITDIQWEYNYSISVQAVSSKGQSKAVVLFLLHGNF